MDFTCCVTQFQIFLPRFFSLQMYLYLEILIFKFIVDKRFVLQSKTRTIKWSLILNALYQNLTSSLWPFLHAAIKFDLFRELEFFRFDTQLINIYVYSNNIFLQECKNEKYSIKLMTLLMLQRVVLFNFLNCQIYRLQKIFSHRKTSLNMWKKVRLSLYLKLIYYCCFAQIRLSFVFMLYSLYIFVSLWSYEK